MAGKGRGVAAFTFNIESLGLTRGSMPETQSGPKPMFPQIEYKPVPLRTGEDQDYMLALKQEIRGRMKGLPFNIKPPSGRNEVERYKEKYVRECRKMEDEEWTPDWNRLPKELMPQKKKIRRKTAKSRKVSSTDKEALMSKLDELEKKGGDKSDDEKEEKEKKKDNEEEEEEVEGEEYDEELEEENDYMASYFEDGDDYGAGSDDNMDEATY